LREYARRRERHGFLGGTPAHEAPVSVCFGERRRLHFSCGPFTEGGPTSVAIRKGEQWNCINPACNGEVFVIASSEWEGGVNPRCSCGSVMKQPYSRPALKTYPATAEARKRVEIPPGLSLEELGYQHERKYKN
jgi:hypothetical protein